MNIKELSSLIWTQAKPRGFKRKGNLFWKTGAELTLLIQLQKSRWSEGVYLNYGVTPNAMVLNGVPPSIGCWGREERAETLESPFRDVFIRLVDRDRPPCTIEEITEAFDWLFKHIEATYGDAEAVRAREIATYGDAWGILSDWANRRLKPPSEYFEGVRYYQNKS